MMMVTASSDVIAAPSVSGTRSDNAVLATMKDRNHLFLMPWPKTKTGTNCVMLQRPSKTGTKFLWCCSYHERQEPTVWSCSHLQRQEPNCLWCCKHLLHLMTAVTELSRGAFTLNSLRGFGVSLEPFLRPVAGMEVREETGLDSGGWSRVMGVCLSLWSSNPSLISPYPQFFIFYCGLFINKYYREHLCLIKQDFPTMASLVTSLFPNPDYPANSPNSGRN